MLSKMLRESPTEASIRKDVSNKVRDSMGRIAAITTSPTGKNWAAGKQSASFVYNQYTTSHLQLLAKQVGLTEPAQSNDEQPPTDLSIETLSLYFISLISVQDVIHASKEGTSSTCFTLEHHLTRLLNYYCIWDRKSAEATFLNICKHVGELLKTGKCKGIGDNWSAKKMTKAWDAIKLFNKDAMDEAGVQEIHKKYGTDGFKKLLECTRADFVPKSNGKANGKDDFQVVMESIPTEYNNTNN